jgi:hypothetical protein
LIYLTGSANPTLREVANKERFGLLLQPATRYRNIIPEFPVWAADNGCFTQPKKFRVDKYLAWLDAHRPYVHTCLFATAPDIVGDAKATWERSAPVLPEIRALGYKAALVGQNGLETMKIEWDEFDVFFVGADDKWKLGRAAAALIMEARARGKWVHMGRVNSYKRLLGAANRGCQSADGTFLRFACRGGNRAEGVRRLVAWINKLDQAPPLEWIYD